jgi:hypothetical protein
MFIKLFVDYLFYGGNRKIKFLKNKSMFSTIAILLTLSFVVSMFAAAGTTNAQETRDILTFPFIDAIPQPAGVGQPVLVNFGLLNNLARDGDGWNVTAVITDPDGNVETFTRMTWSTGTVGITYTPAKEGDYKLQCRFDRTYYNSGLTVFPQAIMQQVKVISLH